MGCFSKCCAKTHLPVLYAHPRFRRLAPHLTEVVVLLSNGAVFEAQYDGYGLGLVDTGQWGAAKLVLKSAYAGESYAQLSDSEDEPQQGFFFSDEEVQALARIPSFATHAAYCDFLQELEQRAEALYLEMLHAIGAPTDVSWYKVVSLLEAVVDCAEDPGNTLALERYASRVSQHPSLKAFFPAQPAQALDVAQRFFARHATGLRNEYARLVDATLSTRACAPAQPTAAQPLA